MKARMRFGILVKIFSVAFLLLVWTAGGFAKQNAAQQRAPVPPADVPGNPSPQISELAKDNYNRVAASAMDIKGVLIGNPGLMVELKSLIAKEASDNGQVVNEDDLTDQAINDRLATDVAFRAAATRLLQRYGYLLPKVNPDSDAAKEQDLILKERARQLVRIEAQEDTNSLQPQRTQHTRERNAVPCDPNAYGANGDCNLQYTGQQGRGAAAPSNVVPQEQLPQGIPGQGIPVSANPGILQAQTSLGEPQTGDLAEGPPPSSLTNVSNPQRRPSDAIPGNNLPPDLSGNAPLSQNPAANPYASGNREWAPNLNSTMTPESARNPNYSPEVSYGRAVRVPTANELAPVAMIHQPSPYSDIPSLYDLYVQAASRSGPPQRFGAEVFRDGLRDPRAIPMDLPVGPDYVVGPGDSLSIDLWGGVSARLLRTVDREGRVTLPEAGPLQVSGRSLGDVQQAVERAIATQFRDTSADVSVSRLRTVRVYVVGEVAEPGAYDISSLSTALNALVAAGGVTPRGSLRELKHYRGRQLLENIDAYDLLLRGVKPDARKLENGDTLMVPPIGPQVTITGMVRRPAVYELNGEKSLADVLELAGGILPAAALQHVEIQRLDAHEKRTMLSLDLSPDKSAARQLSSFKVQDGDEIHIFPIAPYNQDAVYLQGHVLRPGRYSFKPGMKLSDLISSYKDLLPEPAAHYAEIVRLNPPDFRPSVQSFDLAAALANPAAAPKLEPLDTVRIFSRFDFEPAPAVWVGGEVREPGKYITSGQAHLRDAIYLAGGLTPDASLASAQLFRTEADGNTKILNVNLGAAIAGNPLDNILLEPRDRLLIHRNPERVDPPTVDVMGEVAKPGRYPLTGNMRVEDLIRAAGGLKRSADTNTADLTRYPIGGKPGEHLEVSLASVLNGNETEDVPLHNGDVLAIRQVPGWKDLGAALTLRGEVRHPGSYGIQPGERLSSVLERAGGYTPDADPYGAVLMRKAVREQEELAHSELVRRVEAQQANIRLLPEADQDQKNAKITAIAQTQATLDQLRLSPPVGRLVIHIDGPISKWRNTSSDVSMRDGDILVIPKKTDYVMVNGQVFNPTAVSYRGGRSAKWYLGQAGGLTQLADKKGIFVIRADGSVISAKNQSGWWAGNPLSAMLRPGDTVVVPEKALNIGNKNWTAVLQTAQVASSIALTIAYIHP
ncbi:MAG TPA: SLBB domain-containing protein [Candidatus Sulfotelmatobacter sp.]|nr:SLBB domain-containing protein [Candidatus Sulfotelmatobacter sp.]